MDLYTILEAKGSCENLLAISLDGFVFQQHQNKKADLLCFLILIYFLLQVTVSLTLQTINQ